MWAEAVGPCGEGMIEARLGEEVGGGVEFDHVPFFSQTLYFEHFLNVFNSFSKT